MSDIKQVGKKFHDLGFGVMWLKPNSKLPVMSGWTSGDRQSWLDLFATYRPGYNLGVRLGFASKIGDRYLACLDCDVKSTDPRHQKEMESKLDALVPDWRQKTAVTSGRGNGSRHIYVLTRKPSKGSTFKSEELVKALIPSVEPSARDRSALTEEELARGLRMRPAWEISFMGQGRQMVLPPSIHPDSKKPYEWVVPFKPETCIDGDKIAGMIQTEEASAQPVTDTPKPQTKSDVGAAIIDGLKLPESLVAMIRDGEGVVDRSASLYKATIDLLDLKVPEDSILEILTEPTFYLGKAAYDHAGNTKSKDKAKTWLKKYTIEPAKKRGTAQSAFEGEVEELPPLDEAAALEQAEELVAQGDWANRLERGGPNGEGRPKPTAKNVQLILENALGDKPVFRFNLLTRMIECTLDKYPWGTKRSDEVKNIDATNIKLWLARHFRLEPDTNKIWDAVESIADKHAYHPVREYLKSLTWDGKERINTWLQTYFGATSEVGPEYLAAISRKSLVAMVARAMKPGIKFDYVLVLEGEQGTRKSSALRALAGDKWFTEAKLNLESKDTEMAMQGKWLVELAELAKFRSADQEELKAFITKQEDRYRPPYGRVVETFPRESIFIGTTNKGEYLTDETGNRRYWPAKIAYCDADGLSRDRDQLFAEALWTWENMNEQLWLDEKLAAEQAKKAQEGREIHDEWEDLFRAKLNHGETMISITTLDELIGSHPLAVVNTKMDMADQRRAGAALRKIGFEKRSIRIDGMVAKRWVRK